MSKKHLFSLVLALFLCLGYEAKAQVADTLCVTPEQPARFPRFFQFC